jgi:hypothetical protein
MHRSVHSEERNMRIGRLGVGSAIVGGILGITAMVAIGVGVSNSNVFAQTPSPTPNPTAKVDRNADYLAALAGQLGITVDRLKAANLAAQNQLVDQAVAAGRLTTEQGTAAKARLAEAGGAHLGAHFGGKLHRGGPKGFGPFPGRERGLFGLLQDGANAVTTYIGIDAAALKTELAAGKSLAQIATERGKTRDGLKAAIGATLPAAMDAAARDAILNRIVDATHTPRVPRPANAPTSGGGA